MPFVAVNPEKYLGKSVGTGQCVAFVEETAQLPNTLHWKQGKKVAGDLFLSTGTAIATFQNGIYWNSINGSSHAAIYLNQTPEGIYVLDQWVHKGEKQPVHKRLIRFKNGAGSPVDDGDAYYVIEKKP